MYNGRTSSDDATTNGLRGSKTEMMPHMEFFLMGESKVFMFANANYACILPPLLAKSEYLLNVVKMSNMKYISSS